MSLHCVFEARLKLFPNIIVDEVLAKSIIGLSYSRINIIHQEGVGKQ